MLQLDWEQLGVLPHNPELVAREREVCASLLQAAALRPIPR